MYQKRNAVEELKRKGDLAIIVIILNADECKIMSNQDE